MGKGPGRGGGGGGGGGGTALSSTRGPQCSEMNARVQGCVKSLEEQHRKHVELMFRDRNLVLSSLSKSQALVYRTMLRVHKEKKMLQQRRRSKDAPRNANAARNARVATVTKNARVSTVTSFRTDSFPYSDDSSGSDDNNDEDKERPTKTPRLPQLTREATKIESQLLSKPPTQTRSLTLPEIAETNGLTTETKPRKDNPHPHQHQPTTNNKTNDKSSSTWPLPWSTDTDPSEPSTRSKYETGTQVSGGRSLLAPGAPQPSLGSRRLSYLELARMKTSELQMMRKEQLDKEPVLEYETNAAGQIVPVDATKEYQRAAFPIPSLRHQHQQQKLLHTELSAAQQHKQKADRFFEKLEEDNAETAAAARQRRHRAQMAAMKASRSTDTPEKAGITLAELVAVFQQYDELPVGVDPNSLEAVKICKYVRKCRPLMMSEKERQRAKVNKLSSWHYTREKPPLFTKHHAR